ncbi:zf-TFIIB domain-containing protein [Schumannella sp. 10F1B-5-1]|uniref:TFIIB-type zinc ribbon-containing protein n=1 Tax=Schumannella sp. 10F1B-5-1 TaxID=2590780 RepID=UPI0011302357|nr:zf-TFIIB domain-containing protein [Schumannella sp. 10F1B-5-1]TPW70172.1 hypothetical protein FJ658_14210 [Schumannella sp. 10F1B-5-1]
MRCPNDEATLVMSERNGIEIDYCPECRGVWLDRGELDKIIDRASAPATGAASAAPAAPVAPVQPVAQPAVQVQQAAPPPPAQPAYDPRYDGGRYDDRRYDDRRYDNRGGYDPRYGGQQPHRKKKNWLSELFDD